MAARPRAARPIKALTPFAVAAALEVVAGAEPEALEDADEVGVVPVLVPVLEAEELKVTPTARHASLPSWRAVFRSSPVQFFCTQFVVSSTYFASLQRHPVSDKLQLVVWFDEQAL